MAAAWWLVLLLGSRWLVATGIVGQHLDCSCSILTACSTPAGALLRPWRLPAQCPAPEDLQVVTCRVGCAPPAAAGGAANAQIQRGRAVSLPVPLAAASHTAAIITAAAAAAGSGGGSGGIA